MDLDFELESNFSLRGTMRVISRYFLTLRLSQAAVLCSSYVMEDGMLFQEVAHSK